ncbi:MAG: class F sortase [Acidimicrobiales bacterium]
MNQRLISGVFVMAISLALVGAAVTAHKIPAGAEEAKLGSSAVASAGAVNAAQAQVPLRSALLDNQASGIDDSDLPITVRIGDLGLQAPIISVGVDENNQFAVPAADTVGWYQYSATPGSAGSAVLAAHVDYGGRAGAFFNLAQLELGETLEVEMADGSVLRYRVVDNQSYDKTELPAVELFRKDGDPVLTLITCGGTFDSDRNSYRDNVVVTAVPIEA